MAEWISVNDKLPKSYERVLVVCINPQNHMQKHISICYFWGNRPWSSKKEPLWSGHKNVTHWMPLPDLP